MPHHPSLEEVLKERCLYEWMSLKPERLTIKDWVDAEDENGERGSMQFIIECGSASSECGSFDFPNVIVNLYSVPEKIIQNLEGKSPLGGINYYEQACPTININLKEELYSTLLPFISNDLSGLRMKISIPKWEDESSKYAPLLSYQVFYEKEI